MLAFGASVAIMLLVVGVLVTWAVREDRRLRAAARRYRELEFEGIQTLRGEDVYPEFSASAGGRLLEPDGREVDADAVVRRELTTLREEARARDHQ